MAILDQSTVQMYQTGRTDQFIEALEQKTAELVNYAVVEKVGNVEMHKIPVDGTREMRYRQSRDEKISGDEDVYGWRTMRPIMLQDWDPIYTDDRLFLDNLPINLTRIATKQGHAAGRAKDGILMGTCVNGDSSSPLYGEMIVRTSTTVQEDARTHSPYKGGTTSGIFGTAYSGKFGDQPVELIQQPMVMGSLTPLTKFSDYNSSCVLNLRTTNVIPVNFVPSGTPAVSRLTPAKIKAAIAAHRARKSQGQLAMAITHQQALDLMESEEFKNILYGHQVLKEGLPDSIMGVKLLITDYVPLVPVGDGRWVRSCPMWAINDLCYGIWDDAKFEIRQPEENVARIWAGAMLTMGCTRRREETFICIHCDEGIVIE